MHFAIVFSYVSLYACFVSYRQFFYDEFHLCPRPVRIFITRMTERDLNIRGFETLGWLVYSKFEFKKNSLYYIIYIFTEIGNLVLSNASIFIDQNFKISVQCMR